MPFFFIFLLVVRVKPYFFYVGWVFFSFGGGGCLKMQGTENLSLNKINMSALIATGILQL